MMLLSRRQSYFWVLGWRCSFAWRQTQQVVMGSVMHISYNEHCKKKKGGAHICLPIPFKPGRVPSLILSKALKEQLEGAVIFEGHGQKSQFNGNCLCEKSQKT